MEKALSLNPLQSREIFKCSATLINIIEKSLEDVEILLALAFSKPIPDTFAEAKDWTEAVS